MSTELVFGDNKFTVGHHMRLLQLTGLVTRLKMEGVGDLCLYKIPNNMENVTRRSSPTVPIGLQLFLLCAVAVAVAVTAKCYTIRYPRVCVKCLFEGVAFAAIATITST